MVGDCAPVAVIATIFNECESVGDWLEALLSQTRPPDAIVIVDGGSDDGTIDRVRHIQNTTSFPIVLIVAQGANISQGRNLAIERACAAIIAVTDAGTRADPTWLERLVAPLIAGDADVSSGFFVPRLTSRWERALAATTLPDAGEVNPDGFLPSSRSVAFRRSWFDAGLRYPEWLDYCEDVVWDLAMARAGARFRFVPAARVSFAVRATPAAFAKQYARYARGDGKAGLFARRHGLRYCAYAALGICLTRRRVPELLLAAILSGFYIADPIRRLLARDDALGIPRLETIQAIPLVIGLRGMGDIAKMAGYSLGLLWRWRRFGGLGWRTSWRRISPAGMLFRPGAMSTENRPSGASPGGESRAGSR